MKKFLITFFSLLSLSVAQMSFGADIPKAAADLYNTGIDQYNLGNIEKSIEAFNKAIALHPKFYEAYYNLGQIQAASNKVDDAIKTYSSLVEIRPSDDESLYELGNLLYRRGYLKKSLSYLDRISPDSLHYSEAQQLTDKIIKRQKELEVQAAAKKAADEKAAAEQAALQQQAQTTQSSQFSTDGKSTVFAGVMSPSGVAADSAGNMYVASYADNAVYKINKANQKSIFAGPAVINGPLGLAIDANDNVYVANYAKGNILKIAPNGAPSVFLNIKKPYCLSISAQILYITEQETNTTIKFPL